MLEYFPLPQEPYRYSFQQDGAPHYYWKPVTKSLKQHFAGEWISRGGRSPWAPRFPTLTPPDFLLWGCVKDAVYRTKVSDLLTLRRRITDALAFLTIEALWNTWRENRCGSGVCLATRNHKQRCTNITVNVMNWFMFHERPLVYILIKNKVLQFLFWLLSFRTFSVFL
jgi:hypothetical protein